MRSQFGNPRPDPNTDRTKQGRPVNAMCTRGGGSFIPRAMRTDRGHSSTTQSIWKRCDPRAANRDEERVRDFTERKHAYLCASVGETIKGFLRGGSGRKRGMLELIW